jgi:hypothetical protein
VAHAHNLLRRQYNSKPSTCVPVVKPTGTQPGATIDANPAQNQLARHCALYAATNLLPWSTGHACMHACQNCVSRLSLKTAAHKLVDSSSEYVWWIVPVNQLHARGWTDKRSTPRVMGWGRATQDANRNNSEPAHHCTLYASTALLPFGVQLACTHAKMQRGCSQCKSPGAHYAHHHSNKQRS